MEGLNRCPFFFKGLLFKVTFTDGKAGVLFIVKSKTNFWKQVFSMIYPSPHPIRPNDSNAPYAWSQKIIKKICIKNLKATGRSSMDVLLEINLCWFQRNYIQWCHLKIRTSVLLVMEILLSSSCTDRGWQKLGHSQGECQPSAWISVLTMGACYALVWRAEGGKWIGEKQNQGWGIHLHAICHCPSQMPHSLHSLWRIRCWRVAPMWWWKRVSLPPILAESITVLLAVL